MKTTSTIILCGCALLATAPLPAAAEPEVGQPPASPAAAIEEQPFEGKTITRLEIRYVGGQTVDEARIRNLVSSKAGSAYSAEKLDADAKALFESGLVDDVRFLAEEVNGQVKLIAEVTTRGEYAPVGFVGNTIFSDQKLAKETKLPSRGVLSDANILAARNSLENHYHERGYGDEDAEASLRALETLNHPATYHSDCQPRCRIEDVPSSCQWPQLRRVGVLELGLPVGLSGKLEATRVLLENGAPPATRDMYMNAPLMMAATAGNVEILRLLPDHRAPVNVADAGDPRFAQVPRAVPVRKMRSSPIKRVRLLGGAPPLSDPFHPDHPETCVKDT